MKSKKMIVDIQCLINEHYSDKEPLNENQEKSKKVFNDYCEQIKQDLDRLEKLAKTHLAMYVDKDGKIHYPSYKTYVEETKQHTSANLISEEEYNKIIWELENEDIDAKEAVITGTARTSSEPPTYPICPHCNGHHTKQLFGTATSTSDKNEYSLHYKCLDCGREFDKEF